MFPRMSTKVRKKGRKESETLEMKVEGQGECPKYMVEVERQKRSLYNTLETGSPTPCGVIFSHNIDKISNTKIR